MNLTLDYASLAILFIVLLILIFGLIALHDIPYEIAKKRNHPHADAIHVAGWVSLFFLHVMWPFLWIWATMYDGEKQNWLGAKPSVSQQDYEKLSARINQLEQAREGE
ncbi:DUF3302 domain-containing protein [Vibrio sp. B181a]|uniref:DUF3302 domain-containing protein n=1 Tax=Vibrio sp. B181a TaxID=2835906 RepID=UPI0025525EEC|nr:DUF3302 domain-containing protein [Vibrio sp. B181a]MDK9772890.1 DUF3302 domain-containing protein [Vibrio sp. B181a]